jgi:hypothetical protein
MPCKLNNFSLFLDLSLCLSFFSEAEKEVRRLWEFMQEDVGLSKGGCWLFYTAVLQPRRQSGGPLQAH